MLRHRFNWKRLSLAGALAYEPDGRDAHFVFQLRPGANNNETLIELLDELNELEQRQVVLIWDGLPSHHSARMCDWIDSQRHRLRIEPLPGDAHDVNPIEQVWGSPKSKELRNLCPDTLDEVRRRGRRLTKPHRQRRLTLLCFPSTLRVALMTICSRVFPNPLLSALDRNYGGNDQPLRHWLAFSGHENHRSN